MPTLAPKLGKNNLMQLHQITPLILTYNEAPNIDRTLTHLTWASQIIVIDSFSTDDTLDILSQYPTVQVLKRRFDSFAAQCNFGLSHVLTEWTLSLDADYVLSTGLIDELQKLKINFEMDGYRVPFRYCVFGQPLKGTLLPPRTVLYRTAKANYCNDGHAHRVKIEGDVGCLKHPVYHDDRKPLAHWLWAQNRYMVLEAKKLTTTPTRQLSLSDKIRKTKVLAPFMVLLYCLILKGGILDGWRGWYYAAQRTLAELLLVIHLIEQDLKREPEVNVTGQEVGR